MALTTTTTMPPAVLSWYSKGLLATPLASNIHTITVNRRKMPRNSGRTIVMQSDAALPVAMVPLGNTGVTPPSTNFTTNTITAEIGYFGQWLELNEQVELTVQEGALNRFAIRLGVSMRETEDRLTRDILATTASVIYASGGANGDIPTNLNRSDFSEVTQSLRDNNARPLTELIMGDDKFATRPIRESFIGLTSTRVIKDLNQIAGFTPREAYADPMKGVTDEEGSVGNVRVLVSSNGHVIPASSDRGKDVYSMFIMAKDAATIIKQDGYSNSFCYAAPTGPLFLNASLGWKFAWAGRITNDQFMANLKYTLNT